MANGTSRHARVQARDLDWLQFNNGNQRILEYPKESCLRVQGQEHLCIPRSKAEQLLFSFLCCQRNRMIRAYELGTVRRSDEKRPYSLANEWQHFVKGIELGVQIVARHKFELEVALFDEQLHLGI